MLSKIKFPNCVLSFLSLMMDGTPVATRPCQGGKGYQELIKSLLAGLCLVLSSVVAWCWCVANVQVSAPRSRRGEPPPQLGVSSSGVYLCNQFWRKLWAQLLLLWHGEPASCVDPEGNWQCSGHSWGNSGRDNWASSVWCSANPVIIRNIFLWMCLPFLEHYLV